jgi:excisionase family DNA binding protein
MILGNQSSQDRLLRKKVVAARLDCSLRTVDREAQDGRLTRVKVRGGVRFRESEVNKMIEGKRMIFKVEKRRFRENGVVRLTRCYHFRYRFGEMPVDRWKSLGVTDKQVAEKKAQEFIREQEREAAGILEPKVIRTAAMRPLAAHLEDYVADLEKRNRAGRGGRGARQLKCRSQPCLTNAIEGGFQRQSRLLHRLVKPAKRIRRTPTITQAMVSFLNWLKESGTN